MTTPRRLASALALTLCLLALSAHAQTPSIEVTKGDDAAQFSAQGEAQSVRLQVFSPAGELVFEAEATGTQPLRWPLVNQKGGRVPDGLYRAHLTATDAAGRLRTRTEHVTVNEQARAAAAAAAATSAAAPQEPLAPTGAGTAGRLAKWTTSTNLANSVVTESASKLGVNTTVPAATLHIQGLQPAAVAVNGTAATTLLATTGGKGGNTTAAGKVGGKGAGITLTAGSGGNAVAGATNGSGGNITLQPGSAGTGGAYGPSGKVLIAPNGIGSVNIGSSALNTESKLYVVASGTELAVWGDGGVHGSSDVSTGVSGESESGRGVSGYSETGIGVQGYSPNGNGISGISTNGHAGYFDGKVTVLGNVGVGTLAPSRPLEIKTGQLRFSSAFGDVEFTEAADLLAHVTTASPAGNLPAFRLFTGSSPAQLFTVLNNGNVGIGRSDPGARLHVGGGNVTGVWSYTTGTSVVGVHGDNTSDGTGVLGTSHSGVGVHGKSYSSYAGYFSGPAKVTGNLEVASCTGCTIAPSDRGLKANLSPVNARSLLDRLAALPIQAWSYKTDAASVRHVGPMAQDFRAAFGLGTDDKHIDLVDASGVTMASVQALYQLMLEKEIEIKQLRAQLQQVRRTVRRLRAARR